MGLPAPAIGLAGELRVRAELLLRGFSPATFDFDNGTDIILSNGLKIGVKTALKPMGHEKNYSYAYRFSLRAAQFRKGKNGKYKKHLGSKDWSSFVDYWILWCVEDNDFYIIPEKKLSSNRIAIYKPLPDEKKIYRTASKKSQSKYEKFKNNWNQLK